MFKLGLLGALVGVSQAACPNQCSGHGYCDQNDRCTCFKSAGTKGYMRAAYMGADCSQRVCPFGTSHDVISDMTQELLPVSAGSTNAGVAFIASKPADANNKSKLKAYLNNGFLPKADYGVDVMVADVDTNLNKVVFQYKWSNQQAFNQEYTAVLPATFVARENAFSVLDTAGKDTGLYVYWDVAATDFSTQSIFAGDRYFLNVTFNEGVNLVPSDLNTAHGTIECSGRGSCDRATGSCKCALGYTGDACQRTECANDCSGHGTCQSLKYFVEDATSMEYTGFDASAQMGCKCDVGFRGADCSQIECPSGLDPNGGNGGAEGRDCSGRGLCDYTTGICSCFKGYLGEHCEEQSNLV